MISYTILESKFSDIRHYVLLKKDNNSIFFFCFVLFLFISICLFVIFPLPIKTKKGKDDLEELVFIGNYVLLLLHYN